MKGVITSSALMIIIALIIVSHTSVVNKNVRENEVSQSLELSIDYAEDVLHQFYTDLEGYDETREDEYMQQAMSTFCAALSFSTFSDGNFNVYLVDCDMKNGYFNIVIEEEYNYGFFNKTGRCTSERSIKFA